MDVQRKLEILADAAKYDGAGLAARFKPKATQLGFGF